MLECPFCMDRSWIAVHYNPNNYRQNWILCLKCYARGPIKKTDKLAERAWNNRGTVTKTKQIKKKLEQMIREWTFDALKRHNYNRTHAAEELGVPLRTLRYQIRKYKAQGHKIPDAPRGIKKRSP